ncbi:MAG: zinc-dependent metalloprotease [bacterium]
MRRQLMRRIRPVLLGLVVTALGGLGTTCVTEPDPLDKTQSESIHKSAFDGEWYYKMTVIDTEFQNELTFVGEQSWYWMESGGNVRWEITQDHLNGYLQPQKYYDEDGVLVENIIGQQQLVLSFRIERHFDIKYLQNNTTREDLNVIVENTTDRPWDEREYIIVDWSKNLATDWFQPMGLDTETGYIVREPVAQWKNVEFYDVDDQLVNTKAWRPTQDPDIYAMNIDIQEQIHQQLRYWWYLFYYDIQGPTKLTYRFSLKKKNPEGRTPTQYEPKQYRDEFYRRFGYFRNEYPVYDPERGVLESQKQYLVNRWDVGCYTHPDTGEEYCKNMVWYLSPTTPTQEEDPDLYQWLHDAVDTWNDVFQEATGRTDRVFELRDNEPLVDADGNPVYDRYGKQRYRYEFGDIRWNFLNYVRAPQGYGLLGYGPSSTDGDTGEIINGTSNVYGAAFERYVTSAMDYFDVVAGNCTYEDVMAGNYWDEETQACDGGNPGLVAKNGPRQQFRTNFITPALATSYWPKARINQPTQHIDPVAHEAKRPLARELFEQNRRDVRPLDLGKFSIAAGTQLERMMIPSASFGSTFPGARTVDDVIGDFGVSTRLSEGRLFQYRDQLDRKESGHCMLETDFFEPTVMAFVQENRDRPRAEIKQEILRWMIYTTTVHEIGHSLGLAHNFKGSVDKANFPNEFHVAYNEYWNQVETLREQYQDAIDSGDASAYKAYTQAVNAIPSNHYRYGTASIMDYGGMWDQWNPELPKYDRAAILFAYGDKVEVREDGQWVLREYEDGDFRKDDLNDLAAPSESGRVVRYYQFCDGRRRFDDMFCMLWDRGTNATEIMRNFIIDENQRYFFRNFKRDKVNFSNSAGRYYRKWIYTYLMYAKAFAQIVVNQMWYEEFWDSLWTGLDAINDGPEARDMLPGYDREGGEDLLRASFIYYYYLLHDVLQRPDYGLHELVYDTQGNRYWESTEPQYTNADSITSTIDPGPGWGWNDKWDSQYDTTIYEDKLIRIGVEVDKVIAYELLSIPCVFNDYLWHEKANGASYWNDLWNNNGEQLWKITRAFITDDFSHDQNPWCMNETGDLQAMPFSMLEGAAGAGLIDINLPTTPTRCEAGYFPVQPGMDALYAIYPIFYGLSGSQHPWYYNYLSDYMDSQVKGGNHRFDIPYAEGSPEWDQYVAEFTNTTGTKTYQAVQSLDGLSVSYTLVDKARRVSNRIRMYQACDAGDPVTIGLPGTFGRDCAQVMSCYTGANTPAYCDVEGWDSLFSLPSLAWRDVERAEAMLIMMQDMIDLAGHYAWRTPGYLDPP